MWNRQFTRLRILDLHQYKSAIQSEWRQYQWKILFSLFSLLLLFFFLYQWHWTSKMNQAQSALFRFDTLKTFYSLFLIVVVNADHPKCFRCFSTAAAQMTFGDKIKHFCEWIPFSNLIKLSFFFRRNCNSNFSRKMFPFAKIDPFSKSYKSFSPLCYVQR